MSHTAQFLFPGIQNVLPIFLDWSKMRQDLHELLEIDPITESITLLEKRIHNALS